MVIRFADRKFGDGERPFIIAELGVGHLGSVAYAIELARLASSAGADVVKLQFRTPEESVSELRKAQRRSTPWGEMSELDYRRRVELSPSDTALFADFCGSHRIPWTASCWDEPSLNRLLCYDPPFLKIPSARARDLRLIRHAASFGKPVMISTGMCALSDVAAAVGAAEPAPILLAHCVSVYPCQVDQLNLSAIKTLRKQFPSTIVGYSSHERLLWPSYVAVSLGAAFIERHVTLNPLLAGKDQEVSLSLTELSDFCSTAAQVTAALGDGEKTFLPAETEAWERLAAGVVQQS